MTISKSVAYFFMAIAVIGWGFSTIFIENGLIYSSPIWFLAWRFLIATILLAGPILYYKKLQVKRLIKSKWVLAISVSESFGLMFQYFGQNLGASPAISALISLSFLIIVPFLSMKILNEKIYPFHIIAIGFGFIGVLAIQTDFDFSNFNPLNESQFAVTLLVFSAISYAFYVVLTSKYSTQVNTDVDIISLFFTVLVEITAISFVFGFIFEPNTIVPQSEGWIWILALSLISTIFAFFGYFKALSVISANEASVLLLLQVLIPLLFELIVKQISYSFTKWLGIALVITAMVVVVFGSSKLHIKEVESDRVSLSH